MFCKIDNKFYIKMRTFYNEVVSKDGNVIPLIGEQYKVENPSSEVIEVSLEDIIKSEKKEEKAKISFSKKEK